MAFHSDFNTSPSRSLISGLLVNHPEDCVRMSVGVALIRHKDSVCVRAHACVCVHACICTQQRPTLQPHSL